MTDELKLDRTRLRRTANGQLLVTLAVCAWAFGRIGPVKFAANGLAVLASQGMELAGLWRVAGFAIPGLLMAAVAIGVWWIALDSKLRMASVLLALAGLMHAAQALVPIDLAYLLNPVNATAAVLNTLWWLSGAVACVLLAMSGQRDRWSLAWAVVAVGLALLRIGELMPAGMGALTGWAQWAVFGLALAKSVR